MVQWESYKSFTIPNTTNAYVTHDDDGLDALKYSSNVDIIMDEVFHNIVADVPYVELESIPCICNKCKYSKNATVINMNHNNKHEELLCDYNDYTKSVNGGKTKCRHFELREEFTNG